MAIPYSPLTVANTFLEQHAGEAGIEHMKLQKLVYCSYGWLLGVNGLSSPRLTTEGPEIWKHGPVFNSLYQSLKEFGRRPILEPQSTSPFETAKLIATDDENVQSLIGWVWNRYGHLSGFELSDLTHKPGSPWHRVATEHQFRIARHTKIPDEYIFEEFDCLLRAIRGEAVRSTEVADERRAESAVH